MWFHQPLSVDGASVVVLSQAERSFFLMGRQTMTNGPEDDGGNSARVYPKRPSPGSKGDQTFSSVQDAPVYPVLPSRPYYVDPSTRDVHIKGPRRLRNNRVPGRWKRHLAFGVLSVVCILVAVCGLVASVSPDEVSPVPSVGRPIGHVYAHTGGVQEQLVFYQNHYRVIAQEADGETIEQVIGRWIGHILPSGKMVYEARAIFHFSDQTILVSVERQGANGEPQIVWDSIVEK